VKLQARRDPGSRRLGAGILRTAPLLMKALSFLGTAAMFTVGGGILVHGLPPVEHLIEGIVAPLAARSGVLGVLATTLLQALTGIVAGGVAVGVWTLLRRLPPFRARAA
jgi:predicted DNA repair protein MutK